MKRFLLPAFLIAALLSAPATSHASDGPGRKKARTAKALKKKAAVAAPKPTSAANWGATADDDALWATPAATDPAAVPVVVAEPELNDDPAMRSSGVMIAPGMNTAPYRGVSTDYNGRPLNKPAKKVVAAAPAAEPADDDPMMRSSGVMLAPGMNTAPYRGVSTDYNGRPLKKKASKALAAKVATEAPVATAQVPEW